MILADTSVWIEHFRRDQPALAEHLNEGVVLMHPFVSGELACGNLKDRSVVLSYLSALPAAKPATHDEALHFMDRHRIWARGLGWIDVHLLASAFLSDSRFWTLDKRLAQTGADLGLSP
jgi:predicted nucleic acid-binding protein